MTQAFPRLSVETRLRLEYLKPGEIRVKGRLREKDRGLQKLADSMEEYSLLQPVRVRQEGDGGYTLVSGYRRLCAARRLAEQKGGSWETLPCIVVAGEDPVIAQAVENFQRQEMSSYELYKLLILLRDKNRSYGETATLIGCGAARVENLYVTVRELEGDEELEEVFRHAGVTFEDVAITRGIDPERRFALLRQRGNRELTREQLRREAGKLKNGSAAKHRRGTHGLVKAVWRESVEESLNAGRIVISVDDYTVFREFARSLWKSAENAAGKIQITISKEQITNSN